MENYDLKAQIISLRFYPILPFFSTSLSMKLRRLMMKNNEMRLQSIQKGLINKFSSHRHETKQKENDLRISKEDKDKKKCKKNL
jgi:hypothetical protein